MARKQSNVNAEIAALRAKMGDSAIVVHNERPGEVGGVPWSDVAFVPQPVETPKPSKYRNVKTEIDGYVFDSKKEARRYLDLREEQRAGTISELRRQPEWPITMNGEEVCKYVPDFVYRRDGVLVVEDVKSAVTKKLPVYRLKVKLMKACHKIDVVEI